MGTDRNEHFALALKIINGLYTHRRSSCLSQAADQVNLLINEIKEKITPLKKYHHLIFIRMVLPNLH